MILLERSLDRWTFAGFASALTKLLGVSSFTCTKGDAVACAYPRTSAAITSNTPSLDGWGNSTPLSSPVFFLTPVILCRPKLQMALVVCSDTVNRQKPRSFDALVQPLAAWCAVGLVPPFSKFPLNCERKTSHV